LAQHTRVKIDIIIMEEIIINFIVNFLTII